MTATAGVICRAAAAALISVTALLPSKAIGLPESDEEIETATRVESLMAACAESESAEGAIDACSSLLDITEGLTPADELFVHFRLGSAYSFLQKYELAVEEYGEALALNLPTPQLEIAIYERRAEANFFRGDLEAALGDNQSILKLDPGNAQAHNAIAWLYYIDDRPEDALFHSKQAVGRPQPPLHHWNTYAHLLTELGRDDEAYEAFLRAASLDDGGYVRLIQEALRDYGYYKGPPDGRMGDAAKQALLACIGDRCRLLDDEARQERTRR